MGKLCVIVWGIGILLGGVFLYSQNVDATVGPVWDNAVQSVGEHTVNTSHINKSCSGENTFIQIQQGTFQEACTYGSLQGSRVARYRDAHQRYQYAFSKNEHARYYPVQYLCEGQASCVYSQASDVFIMKTVITIYRTGHSYVRDFSKHLTFNSNNGGYFEFNFDAEQQAVSVGDQHYSTGAIAITANGNWAVVELYDYGIIRVNLHTLSARRVVAPGATYGVGNDPKYELAIADSGQFVAIVGIRVGISIYEVNDTCGDSLHNGSSYSYSSSTVACKSIHIDRYAMFSGFISAHDPVFSKSGDKLSIHVVTNEKTISTTLMSTPESLGSPSLYFALGDSFTSGEGEVSDDFYIPSTNTASNSCHVSTRSYPFILGSEWATTTQNLACSGARSIDMQRLWQAKMLDKTITSSPNIISLGIGGNDVASMGKLKTCLGVGTCDWARPEKRAASAFEMNAIIPSLLSLIASIKKENPQTKLLLIGYPLIINSDESAHCRPVIASLLDGQERQFMNESIKHLNKIIQTAAYLADIQYIDIENALSGERLCDTSENSVNGIRMGNDIAPFPTLHSVKLIGSESFHPTPRGHQRIAEMITQQVNGTVQHNSNRCQSCHNDIVPSGYWTDGQQATELLKQFTQAFMHSKDILMGDSVEYSFPIGTFLPHSQVTLNLHSEPAELDKVNADTDGSLRGTINFPDSISGYHTVHAYGKDLSQSDIDIYEIVAIEQPFKQDIYPIFTLDRNPISADGIQDTITTNKVSPESVPKTIYSAKVVSASSIFARPIESNTNKTTVLVSARNYPWPITLVVFFAIICVMTTVCIVIRRRSLATVER